MYIKNWKLNFQSELIAGLRKALPRFRGMHKDSGEKAEKKQRQMEKIKAKYMQMRNLQTCL